MRLDERSARRIASARLQDAVQQTQAALAQLPSGRGKTRTSARMAEMMAIAEHIFGDRLVESVQAKHLLVCFVLEPCFAKDDPRHLLHVDTVIAMMSLRSGKIQTGVIARFSGHAIARLLERKTTVNPLSAIREEFVWRDFAEKFFEQRQLWAPGDKFSYRSTSGEARFVVNDRKIAVAATWIGRDRSETGE